MVYPPRTTSLVLVKFRDPIENYISISFSVRIFFWIRTSELFLFPKLGYRNTESPGKSFKMSSARRHLFLTHTYFHDTIQASKESV